MGESTPQKLTSMAPTVAKVAVCALATVEAFQPSANFRPSMTQMHSIAPARHSALSMSLDYNPDAYQDPNNANYRKRSDKLKEADVERRLAEEESERRLKAAQRKREERQRRIESMNAIPDYQEAGRVADYMFKEGVQDILTQLDHDLVGLVPVKARVKEIASLLVVDKMRRKLGLETAIPSLHMGFTGAPGTGKTTVALRMGQILQKMGYCRSGHVVIATRDDLVGQYVGHTAPKTKEMVKKAMGGILLNVMENNKEDLIVVLAGYQDKMERFYSFIPGMESRIGNHIEFPNYEVDELVEIGSVMCRELEYIMGDGAVEGLKEYLAKRIELPFFANARTVRNAIDLARMRAAIRIFNEKMADGSDGVVSEEGLQTITGADSPELDEDALVMA